MYVLKPWVVAGYFLLFAAFAGIALTWLTPEWRVLDAVVPELYNHTTNLVLSAGLVLSYGLIRLMMGASMREIALFTAVVIAANYVYELLLPLWNTRDAVDAHYGVVGSVVPLVFLWAASRWGLVRRPAT